MKIYQAFIPRKLHRTQVGSSWSSLPEISFSLKISVRDITPHHPVGVEIISYHAYGIVN